MKSGEIGVAGLWTCRIGASFTSSS